MSVVTVTCQGPAPASAAFKALLGVLGMDSESAVTEAATPSAAITTKHALLGQTSSTTATSWVGCLRAICQQVPSAGLWGLSSAETALVESWVESATLTLVPILVGDKKDAVFESAVQEYSTKLDNWLADKTYVVGEMPTAADVCIALWLKQAYDFLGLQEMPSNCLRWTTALLSHDLLKNLVGSVVNGTVTTGASSSSAADSGLNEVIQKLEELKIEHTSYSHTLCMTAEELVANVPIENPNETHTKNLFLRDKKHGLFLVTVLPDTQVNTKELGTMLGLKGKTNLRLADAELLEQHLGCKPGCLGPLAIFKDGSNDVTLALDKGLLEKSKIHSHPLRNDASVVVTPAALQDYIAKTNHEPVILDFGSSDISVSTAPPKSAMPSSSELKAKEKTPKETQEEEMLKKTAKKGETLLALQWTKEGNFPMWYSDVITLSEMIAYYDISGCYILRPWSYKIWELIQEWFNEEIRKLGVENCYFPLFVTQDRLEKEKDHLEGFSPEVAWVTRSGSGDLNKPIAVRPTSETIMYPAFSDWIKSHRDLPLKLNQWSNVVRWEFKYPTPFLRSREFLWQEGHTAHATYDDAQVMVRQALELYRGVYEDLLAVPVIPGYKTEAEKFAGGLQTTTVEAYVPVAGRAIQGATSHNLGQNFGKMFDITFQDAEGKTETAWQTSWGLTTRTIGVMIMVHGDDTGLVLPPRIAPLQVVIVPIVSKKVTIDDVAAYCDELLKDLNNAGIRAKFDDRTMYNPGWKYNHWEQKGVPIRIEIGPRDIENKQARIVVRYSGEKYDLPAEGLGLSLVGKLEEIQKGMFDKAKQFRDDHVVQVTDWKDFVPNLEKHNLVLTPWCGGEHEHWEDWVKNKSREESLAARGEAEEDARTATSVAAKTLCIPFNQPELPAGTKCFASGLEAKCWVLWGRSY